MAAYVGLDWADEKHAVCLQAAASNEPESDMIEANPDALREWVAGLRSRFGGRPVGIILEQSKGAVIHFLMAYDFLVLYPINPKALAKYRAALRCSGAKDDPSDAQRLLKFLRAHPENLRPWRPNDAATRHRSRRVADRRAAVDERTRLTNERMGRLKEYFPQALLWAGELTSVQAHDFLLKWPTLTALQKATPNRIRQFYLQHGGRRPEVIEERVQQIQTAHALTNDEAVVKASTRRVQTLVNVIRPWTEAIESMDAQLKELFAQHSDYQIFKSFPGGGAVLGPRLLVAMGSERER